ncbi:MAG: hypothetical protein ACOYK8_01480 [Alphaproteobacteria bacterium]
MTTKQTQVPQLNSSKETPTPWPHQACHVAGTQQEKAVEVNYMPLNLAYTTMLGHLQEKQLPKSTYLYSRDDAPYGIADHNEEQSRILTAARSLYRYGIASLAQRRIAGGYEYLLKLRE